MSDVEWIEVATGPDLRTARLNFSAWLRHRDLTETQIEPEAIRIDTIRGRFKDRRRIMIRKEAFESLGRGHR